MKNHAKLSPSAAHRWLKCTASPTIEAQYKNETSVYAAEGTEAHEIAEVSTLCALGKISERDFKNHIKHAEESFEFYNQEMLDYCEEYSQFIKEKFFEAQEKCPDAFVDLEVQLDLSSFIPESFGTADCIIVAEPEMWVIDFKYGKGVKVEAKGNAQMEIYALGALSEYGKLYDVEKINMAIVQPRLGGVSEYSMDREQLIAWANVGIIPAAKEAFEGPGRFVPSESACKFCKARSDCKARADHFLKLFDENQPTGLISVEEAGQILEKASGIKDWLADIEAKVFNSLMEGSPVEGWKLVEGKSNRKISNEEEAAKVLKTKGKLKASEIYQKKLNTITNLEKILGKKKFADLLGSLVIKPEGKPTLAPASDKRPEIFPAEEIVKAFDE